MLVRAWQPICCQAFFLNKLLIYGRFNPSDALALG